MQTVIQVSGKAKQVFKYIEVLGRHKNNATLKELAKERKTFKLDLKS